MLKLSRQKRIELFNQLIHIDSKVGEVVPLKLNKAQRYFQENKTNRNIILKARQIGISSSILADMFLDCITVPHTSCAVVSHETHATQRLLDRVQFYYDSMDNPKPIIGAESRSEKTFPEFHSTFYVGTAGCLHPDSTVLLAGGYKKAIKNITQGDRIYRGKGRSSQEVNHVITHEYSGKMIEISVVGNPSEYLSVTPDHRFQIHKRWIPASQIVSPSNSRGDRVCYFIKPIRNTIRSIGGVETNYELGWVFGLYMAEGWFGGAYTSFGLNLNETEYRNKLEQFAIKNNFTFRWRQHSGVGTNGMEVSIGSKPFMDTIQEVFGKDKEVPDWFWNCGVNFLNGIIDGYVAGDGSEQANSTKVTSVRPHLLYQLRDMLLSTRGIYSGIYKLNRNWEGKCFGGNQKIQWELDFPLFDGIKTHQYRKSSRSKQFYKYISIPIYYKEVDYQGVLYDLDCGGSFSTPSCLVHNSRAFGRGDTIRKALLSEASFYEDGETIWNGLEDAVPITGELTAECFDDQTEVLTDRGWLLFKDVLLTDRVFTKNSNNEAYWSTISHKIERPATELIHVTGKGIDFAVTPNHNLWAKKSGTVQPFMVYQAHELFGYSEWEFDTSLDWVGAEQDSFFFGDKVIPMDLWLEYLGFFCSEGWVTDYSVSIYQDGIYTPRFKEVTQQVASYFGRTMVNNTDGCTFTVGGKSFAEYFGNFTKPKRVPKFVLGLSKRQLSIFLKAYLMGDGEKKRFRCCTIDKPLRDAIQEIGLKLGYRTNYVTNKAKGMHKESYCISFYKSSNPSVRQSRNQINYESYSGKVYCLSLPTDHFLMVRRNGKAIWLQNCSPNGEDNCFYERWVKAREGKSPYKPFFFPWWWSNDYSIPKGSSLALPEDQGDLSFTKEEVDLMQTNSLTEAQIRWRRWKIAEKGGLFFQEYPEDEVSCFITIGDPVFDSSILNMLSQQSYTGQKHEGGWIYWVSPEPKQRYVIGADSAAGSPTGSYSTAVVLDDQLRVCATFQARLDPHQFALLLKRLGVWYNTAEIAIERNFTGYAVLEQLRDYPNVFYQRDMTTGKVTTQKGWWTNDQTRELLMTVTREKLSQLKLWDVNLIRQLRSYRYLKLKTKFREESQTFDDLAIALMIAVVVKKLEGGSRGFQGYAKIGGWWT